MKFGPVSLADAAGQILAHNVSDESGRRVLRKGQQIDSAALDQLTRLGFETVFVAQLEEGDIHENEAAERIARIIAGTGIERAAPHAGRVNLAASEFGVISVDTDLLLRLNGTEGVTVSTLSTHAVVRPGERAATVKVIPYAVASEAVADVEANSGSGGIVSVRRIDRQPVAIILAGGPGAWQSLRDGIGYAIRARIEALRCLPGEPVFTPADEQSLSDTLARQPAEGVGLVVVAGETAIMDVDDLLPRALVRAGGRLEELGLPMDPGQLLLLGYLGKTPVVGAPGCVRGTSPDGFDAVVPRLLSGERLCALDLQKLGHGGLLSDPRGR